MKQLLSIRIFAVVFMLLFISIVPIGLCEDAGARIQRELDLNLSIDVPVISGVPSAISTIQVEPAMIDANACEKALAAGLTVSSKEKYESGSVTYGTKYYANYEGDITLSTDNMTIYFSTPLSSAISSTVSYHEMLDDRLKNTPDLSFMPRSQVKNEVDVLLSSLGIDNAQCHAIYAFDEELMADIAKKSSESKSLKDDTDDDELVSEETWAREDECYWLKYRLLTSGVPLFPRAYDILGFDAFGWFMGSNIDILVTQSGIIGLQGNGLVKAASEDTPEAILSQDAAMKYLKKKYENVLLSEPMDITEMELFYILQPDARDKEALCLIPTWCFGNVDGIYYNVSIIDARDGRVIQ